MESGNETSCYAHHISYVVAIILQNFVECTNADHTWSLFLVSFCSQEALIAQAWTYWHCAVFARPSKDSAPPWSIQCGCHQGYSELCVAYKFVCLEENLVFFCGKLSREIFCEFRGFLAICESFLRKIWGQGIFWWHKWATRRSFLCENHFLPRKFPTVRLQIHHNCTPILCYDSLSCDNLVHFVRECIFLLAPLCSPSSFLFPLLLFVPPPPLCSPSSFLFPLLLFVLPPPFFPSPPFCSPSSFLFPSPDYCWHCP